MNKDIAKFITCARNLGRHVNILAPIFNEAGKREPKSCVEGGFFLRPDGRILAYTTPVSCHFLAIAEGDERYLTEDGLFFKKMDASEWQKILKIQEGDAVEPPQIRVRPPQCHLLSTLMAEGDFPWGYVTTDHNTVVYWPLPEVEHPSTYLNLPLVISRQTTAQGSHLLRSKLLLPLMRYVVPEFISFKKVEGVSVVELLNADLSQTAVVSELDLVNITVGGTNRYQKDIAPELKTWISHLLRCQAPALPPGIDEAVTDKISSRLFR